MPRFIKLTLIALLSIGIIFIAVIAGVILSLDLNDHETRQRVLTEIEEQTGRKITVTGPINFSLYPWLGLELQGLAISNADGFGDAPFVRGDAVSLRIKALPLLKKQYEFDTLRLHGVEINLAKNSVGLTNWADLGGERGDDAPPSAKKPLHLAAVILGGVDIKNARLTWHDQTTGRMVKITDLNMQTSALSYSEPVDIGMDLKLETNQPQTIANVKMHGTATYNRDTETYKFHPLTVAATLVGDAVPNGKADATLVTGIAFNPREDMISMDNLTLDALGTQVNATLHSSEFKSGKFQGQFAVIGDDLATLLKLVGMASPAKRVATLNDRSFELTAEFHAETASGDLAVSTLHGRMLGATIEGQLDAHHLKTTTPSFSGNLQASAPDLPLLIQLAGQFQRGGKHLNYYGERLSRLSNKQFELATQFGIDLDRGDIDLPSLSIKALGLALTGKLAAQNFSDKRGQIDGQFSLQGNNMAELLSAMEQRMPPLIGQLGGISADIKILGEKGRFTLDPLVFKAMIINPAIPAGSVPITLTATPKVVLGTPTTLMVDDLRLDGLGMEMHAKINADFSNQPRVTGELRVNEFDLRKLIAGLNRKPPLTANETALQKVAMQTNFATSANDLQLKDIALVLDDTIVKGEFLLEQFNRPNIRFNFSANNINVDHYLPPNPKKNEVKIAQSKKRSKAAGLPLDLLRKLNVVGNLQLDKLIISDIILNKIMLGIDAKEGLLKLDPITADLYGGNHQGTISLDASAQSAVLEQTMQLNGVELEPLLRDLQQSPKSPLAGTANITTQLSARGADLTTFQKGLNGKAELHLTQGVLRGIDIGNALKQAELIIESKRFGEFEEGGETPFEEVTGSLNILDGVVKTTELVLAAPGFEINGGVNQKNTLVDLSNNHIDYDLSIVATEQSVTRGEEHYNIGGYQIPIKCRGTLENIASACKPDFAKLLSDVAKKAVVEKIGDKIGIDLSGKRRLSKKDGAEEMTDDKEPSETPQKKGSLDQLKEKAIEGFLDKIF